MDSMDEGDLIIDISSDEEDLVDESVEISEEWINELLGSEDVELLEESDDVVVVNELSAPLFVKKQVSLQKESDEDCVILDGDPDKAESVVDGKSEAVDGCAELLIVGEKGHLACRDYPHPRHLCLSFSFSSTPHEKHCKLCHCYVCDSLAPCIYWGYGLSTTDHCHANDKEQDWKLLRNYFKLVNTKVSEPLRSSQDSYHRLLGLSNTPYQSSTTGFTAIIPDLSIQREHQPLSSSFSSVRSLPVNRGTWNLIGSQSFHRSHSSLRMLPFPNYVGSTSNESSGLYTRDRLDSNQLRRSSVQRFPCSQVLQGSRRAPLVSPLANRQSKRPKVSNNVDLIQCTLASIEAHLLGVDYDSASMEESNIPSSSTLYPAFSKPSIIR